MPSGHGRGPGRHSSVSTLDSGIHPIDDEFFYGEAGAVAPAPARSWLTFVLPSDVKAAKNRLQPSMASTRSDAQTCAGLPQAQKDAFEAFYQSWRQFYCRDQQGECTEPDASYFSSAKEMDELQAFEVQLSNFQAQIAAKCSLSSPPIVLPQGGGDVTSALKWTAAIVAGVAVIYIVSQTGLPRFGRKRT